MKHFEAFTLKRLVALALFSLCSQLALAWEENQPKVDTAELAASTSITEQDYQINPGDILSVSVWREADLQRDVLVRPDGKFSFPLAGDVQAKGKSVEQVRQILGDQLSRYIPDLVVSVSVLAINGNKIFVIGQVNRAGEINANPHVDVMQALSIAGGTNPYAQVNNISILRRSDEGLISIPFRYGDIEKGKRLEQNIVLQAGDVVVVP
jgi:polysaccharide export outer membrane protein